MSRQLYVGTKTTDYELKTIPLKELAADHVRVAVKAVAINPVDLMLPSFGAADGLGTGSDFVGVVTQVGSAVAGVKVGDEVAGMPSSYNSENPEAGAFANILDYPGDGLLHFNGLTSSKESHLGPGPITTWEQAASVPGVLLTAALAFIYYSKIPIKKNSQKGFALVYAGGSSLGFNTAQLAKYLGYEVIAIAARKHLPMYKAANIEHVLDYHDDWVPQAKAIGEATWAFDAISNGDSFKKVYETVSHTLPVRIIPSLPVGPEALPEKQRDNVNFESVSAFLWFDEARPLFGVSIDPAFHKTRGQHFKDINLALKEIVAMPVEIVKGFKSIPATVARVKSVSGTKLVVDLE